MQDATIPHTPAPRAALPAHATMAENLLCRFNLLLMKGVVGDTLATGGRAFQVVAARSDAATGARMFAFREVTPTPQGSRSAGESQPPASDELILAFDGRTRDLLGTRVENAVAADILTGGRSRQIASARAFIDSEIKPYLAKHPHLSVDIFAFSMGAGNGLLAKHLLDPIAPVKATLFEPFAAAHEAGFIARESEHPEAVLDALRHNVCSIRSHPPTIVAKMPVGNSTGGNKQFGDTGYIFNTTSHAPMPMVWVVSSVDIGALRGLRAMAKLLPQSGLAPEAPAHATPKEGVLSTIADSATGFAERRMKSFYHNLDGCAPLLVSKGDAALILSAARDNFASNEELLHPERYRLTQRQLRCENIVAGLLSGL